MKTFLLFIMLLASASGMAQSLPEEPKPQPHRFFDRKNDALIALSVIPQIGDALSTQKLQTNSYTELNPVARPFVGSRQGQAFISAVGFGAEIGGMYLAHRRGWHRLERLIPVAVCGVETWMTIRNYGLR